jgi:hypothetical protein
MPDPTTREAPKRDLPEDRRATSGATPQPKVTDNTGHQRAANAQLSSPRRPASQVVRPPWFSLARRKSPGPRSALGLCRNGHAQAPAVTNGHRRSRLQAARLPAHAIGMLQAANQLAVPEVVDREIPGGPLPRTVGRREPTYFCGIPPPDWTKPPAPNSPTRLHITPQPDQEPTRSSQFARRSRSVETPAFVTGPQSHRGEKAS